MQSKFGSGFRRYRKGLCLAATALLLSSSFFLTGCLSSLAKPSAALSAATTPVLDQAASAYRNAEALHDLRVDYDAVPEFDATQPVYNPRTIQPLMSDKDIEVRLAVLSAFQCYVQSLVAITNGTSSPGLDAASRSVGASLSTLGNSLAPAIESTLGIAANKDATATSSTSSPLITPEIQNGISTGMNALAQFLVSKKIKKELPQKIKEMDPHLQALCEALERDIATLEDQELRDYNRIINQQTLFLRQHPQLDPQQHREQVMKLPEVVRQQRASAQQLVELRGSIVRLAQTHHALVEATQGNTQIMKDKLSDLAVAGTDLGKFYSSLPTP